MLELLWELCGSGDSEAGPAYLWWLKGDWLYGAATLGVLAIGAVAVGIYDKAKRWRAR